MLAVLAEDHAVELLAFKKAKFGRVGPGEPLANCISSRHAVQLLAPWLHSACCGTWAGGWDCVVLGPAPGSLKSAHGVGRKG